MNWLLTPPASLHAVCSVVWKAYGSIGALPFLYGLGSLLWWVWPDQWCAEPPSVAWTAGPTVFGMLVFASWSIGPLVAVKSTIMKVLSFIWLQDTSWCRSIPLWFCGNGQYTHHASISLHVRGVVQSLGGEKGSLWRWWGALKGKAMHYVYLVRNP